MRSFFSVKKYESKTRNRGFSLIEVMLATGLISLTAMAVMALSQLSTQDSLQLRVTRIALTARSQIEAALKNPAAWRQSVSQNTSFACVGVAPGCSLSSINGGYYDFVLYGVTTGEKISYDAADATTRLSIQGGACPAGVSNPHPQCPLKFMARWKPLCETYPCKNPTVDIKISVVTEFGSNAPTFNAQRYDLSTVRGIDDGSLQSACQILNGTYNSAAGTCYPKYAGKSCALLGKPAQIVSSVAADGTISCTPLYNGQCNETTQVMNAIDSSGTAQCAARSQPSSCPTPCVGGWGACSATCGGGTQTYAIITPATNGGPACTSPSPGSTQACNTAPCPVNCAGNWSACSVPCGGGTMTYSITQAAQYGGANCPSNSGDTQACNTGACVLPVNCAGNFSSCNPVTGTKTFSMTQAPQGSGQSCMAIYGANNGGTVACPVDCVGSWGECAGGPPQFKTYTWTTPPLNGGTSATCTYPNGQTDTNCGAVCGSSNGVPTATVPTNLCAVGSPVPTSMSLWAWDCVGATTVHCSAPYSGTWHKFKMLGPGDYACNLGGPYTTQAGCGPPGCASCGCMATAYRCDSTSGAQDPW